MIQSHLRTGDAVPLVRALFAPTRLVRSPTLSRELNIDVHLKLECELPTGSFKVRGAYVALRAAREQGAVNEVVAASTGNHGAAVAWAARELGVAARVFVPVGANRTKTTRIEHLGARLSEVGADIEGSRRAAEAYAAESGAFLLDDATSADVPAGAATIGLELMEQLPDVATVVVPVGDSALVRGVAAAVKGVRRDVRIVGVQAVGAPAYHDSWRSGRVETTETANTIADGLATTTPTAPNVASIRELVDDMVLVSEQDMIDAMRVLREHDSIVAEPAGAAPIAALRRGRSSVTGPVVAIVTGGNVAPEVEAMAWPSLRSNDASGI
jgi:threonine dehydratase